LNKKLNLITEIGDYNNFIQPIMAKKKHPLFFILRIAVVLFLALILFLNLSSSAVSMVFFSHLSTWLSGGESMMTPLRITSSFVIFAIAVLLLLKKPDLISLGAFLATGLFVVLQVIYVVVMSYQFGEHPVIFVSTWTALIASLVLLFRFRGSLPVLGKFT
jgi:hypothetical protein